MFNLIKFLKRKYKENEIKEMERILHELDDLSLVLEIIDEKGRYIFHPDSFACSNLDHELKVYTELIDIPKKLLRRSLQLFRIYDEFIRKMNEYSDFLFNNKLIVSEILLYPRDDRVPYLCEIISSMNQFSIICKVPFIEYQEIIEYRKFRPSYGYVLTLNHNEIEKIGLDKITEIIDELIAKRMML